VLAAARGAVPRRALTLAVSLTLAASVVGAACGSGGEPPEDGAGATTKGAGVRETVDRPARVPAGWKQVVNRGAGFSIGLPPGWEERPPARGQGSVLRSPDDLAVVTITADRTAGALQLPLGAFARRSAEALGEPLAGRGRLRKLKVRAPARFKHRYDGVAVRAIGTAPGPDRVAERILVAVVRREGAAAYVAVVRENAERDSEFIDRRLVMRLIRSLRGRPAQ
jgi:hypothetical protein